MRSQPGLDLTPAANAGATSTGSSSTVASSVGSLRIARVGEVTARTGLSRTTLWRLERRGAFPARRQLSPGTVGWIAGEVEDWIRNRHVRTTGEHRSWIAGRGQR